MTMTNHQAAQVKPKRSRRAMLQIAATLLVFACSLHSFVVSSTKQNWTDRATIRGRNLLAVADDLLHRCRIPKEYRLSKQPTSPTYLASFHGGTKVISNLAHALTGIATTNQVNYSRRRRDHSVLFETHYPLHGAMKLQDDEHFRGAILLLRNPITAILASFNAFYARQYHYLIDVRAPPQDWIRYRDSAQFAAQVKLYENFVVYWMNKYKSNRQDLLLITYEGLTGGRGAAFTKQIGNFLDKSEGIHIIDFDSIPCIWEKFVHDKWYPEQEADGQDDASSAAPTGTSFQERWDDRPFKKDQLRMISRMLSSLNDRYGSDDQFSGIMNSYINSLYDYSQEA